MSTTLLKEHNAWLPFLEWMDNFMTYHSGIAHSTEQTFKQPIHYNRLYVLGIKRRRHRERCLQCNLILGVIECWENNDSRKKKEIDLIGTNLRRLLGRVDILSWNLKMNGNVLLAEGGWRGKRQQRKWWSMHVCLDTEWPCLRWGRRELQAQGHSVVFLEHLYLSAWEDQASWDCWAAGLHHRLGRLATEKPTFFLLSPRLLLTKRSWNDTKSSCLSNFAN